MRRLGLPKVVLESIMHSYKDLSTTIENSGSSTDISLMIAVKQGDPLSPIIFNAIMDPLLEQLQHMKGYVIDDSHSLSALAFADDLILLATTKDTAQRLFRHTVSFLNDFGCASQLRNAHPSKSCILRIYGVSPTQNFFW